MRRKALTKNRPSRSYDIRKDIPISRLAAFGAVIIAWNDIEASVDTALGMALGLPQPMWIEISSRINGLDGKLPIIKRAIAIQHKIDPETCKVIADTFGQVERYKRFRDGIIHAKIFDPDDAIAPTTQRKGLEDEVLVSESALYQLYDILIGVRDEMDDILFMLMAMNSLSDPISEEEEKQSAAQSIQSCALQLIHHQKTTQALPLPQFPAEPPISSRDGRAAIAAGVISLQGTIVSGAPDIVNLCSSGVV